MHHREQNRNQFDSFGEMFLHAYSSFVAIVLLLSYDKDNHLHVITQSFGFSSKIAEDFICSKLFFTRLKIIYCTLDMVNSLCYFPGKAYTLEFICRMYSRTFFFSSQGASPFTLRKVSFFLLLFRAKRAILSGAKDTYCSYLVKLEQTRKIVTTYNTALIHFSCWKM